MVAAFGRVGLGDLEIDEDDMGGLGRGDFCIGEALA